MSNVISKIKIEDHGYLNRCPCCTGRCIKWRKNDLSYVVACVKCRYHMGPYTRSSDAVRAHNRRIKLSHSKAKANKRK